MTQGKERLNKLKFSTSISAAIHHSVTNRIYEAISNMAVELILDSKIRLCIIFEIIIIFFV